ncbi:DedA family protein [Qipengyuania sp.]|uniref:DedA family protein n=1 Tax=Qipengyuania sp. TaxID=2004515 RepID=UPI0035C7BEE3
MNLSQLISDYGLWAVGLGAGIEGETVLILGGMAVHRGLLPLVPAILAAAAGSFVADQIFFAIGRRFRDAPRVMRLRKGKAYGRAMAAFHRHPTGFVFAFRFIYGFGTISPLAIGTSDLPASRFVIVNALAALVWSSIVIGAGYAAGQTIEAVFGRIRPFAHVVVPAIVVTLVLALVVRRIFRSRMRKGDGFPETKSEP